MIITDVDELGNLIVSSWSKKYKFLADSVNNSKGGFANIRTITFKLQDGVDSKDNVRGNVSEITDKTNSN